MKMKQHNIKEPKKKVVLQNVALVFASLLVFFIVLEIVLRFFGYGNLVIYKPDPKLYWKPLANQNCYTKVNHKPVHINSKGTRGAEFDAQKPSNVFRILSLGDSRTFGWGLSDTETYSSKLQRLLQKKFGKSKKVEVINAGVNAWSYSQMYVYLRDFGIKYDPDVVIIADANLWTQFTENNSKDFIRKFMRRVWLKNLLRTSAIYHFFIEVKLRRYYEKYRTKFIPISSDNEKLLIGKQIKDPASFFQRQITKMIDLILNNHIKGMLLFIPSEDLPSNQSEQEILRIKKQISNNYKLPLIDLSEDFREKKIKLFLPEDPIHPNVNGNILIANKIYSILLANINN